MNYNVRLTDSISKETICFKTPHFTQNGTHCKGGESEASLNISHILGGIYRKCIDKDKGIERLKGMTGKESLPVLERAESAIEVFEARLPLLQLISMAKMAPDGVWQITSA